MRKVKAAGNPAMCNILMVGVGGQGIILASDIVARAALFSGYDVKKSEVHGMSQRGGSVFSHIRFGRKVFSPLIGRGQAEVLLSLEEMETLRWREYAHPDGTVIVARTAICPANVREYPKGIEAELARVFKNLFLLDTDAVAGQLGGPKFTNAVLVGAVSCFLTIENTAWSAAIEALVPAGTIEQNKRAFEMGKTLMRKG